MNIGKNILELRKKKNVTQEDLAAELGVTAAAVSKRENGYTLPDILMLCALADYFCVTTDELLGRISKQGLAIVAADTEELAEKIKAIAAQNGIVTQATFHNSQDAVAAVRDDYKVTHLIMGFQGRSFPEIPLDLDRPISLFLSLSESEQGILNDLRDALKNNN